MPYIDFKIKPFKNANYTEETELHKNIKLNKYYQENFLKKYYSENIKPRYLIKLKRNKIQLISYLIKNLANLLKS
jgi:hypothetical protein